MNIPSIHFEGNYLYLANYKKIELNFEISNAFILEGKVIVLYDSDCNIQEFGQFANIEAFSVDGHKLWTVELPTTSSGDAYYEISSKRPLVASSVKSFQCTINPSTGKIIDKIFYK